MKFRYIPSGIDIRDYKICSSNLDIDYPQKFELDINPSVKNHGGSLILTLNAILEYHVKNLTIIAQDFTQKIEQSFLTILSSRLNLRLVLSIILKQFKYLDSYYLCNTKNDIKYSLMNFGPIMGMIPWYINSCFDKDNVIIFDTSSTYTNEVILVVGWDSRGWIIQNLYDKRFGQSGRFILPYYYNLIEAWAVIKSGTLDMEQFENILIQPKIKLPKVLIGVWNKIINLIKMIDW